MKRHFLLSVALLFCAIIGASRAQAQAQQQTNLLQDNETVHTVPFFEGFENGNKQDSVIQGWIQQSENGSSVWKANSTNTGSNRTPYAGSWNATLSYNNNDWLFTYIRLEAGKQYRISMMARQDGSKTSQAEISVCLGSAYGKDAMTLNILPTTAIINGDYQRLEADFTVPTTAAYAMGIRGYIGGSPYYISLDNILVEELPTEVVTAAAS